ncbi:MAG: Crp/Fnr family transcriptional regulator [Bacteroidetes bacterium GWA2_31_9]|nr:MAG: Crp/Fnr family transcriptional regulator [Bacteroidetes bacterium GWA2_31_9]
MNSREINCESYFDNKRSIFYTLSPEEKKQLSKNISSSFYKKGDIIFKEGDKPSGLICLAEGKVKIFKEGVGGREQIVRLARPIGFIGYRALFAEENYNSSAVALEDSFACIIDKDSLFRVLHNNNQLTMTILRTMASELGLSNSRTVTLTQKHIRGRLAESLIFLKNTYGFEEDGHSLKVYLSREDIANLSNMTTSNAIRTLSSFASEKVISLDGRKIKIMDLSKLERISDLG